MAEAEPNAPATPIPDGLPPLRTEDGDFSPAFLDALRTAIEAADARTIEALAADLHEADVGDIIGALSPDERAPFIQLLGEHFDFTALTEVDETVRVQLIEELPPEAVAEGVRDLDSDDAVYIQNHRSELFGIGESRNRSERNELLGQALNFKPTC
jgi:magnesium transporter